MKVSEWEFVEEETIIAGNTRYKTDCLRLKFNDNDIESELKVNHISRECPNCQTINELCIELRTDSLYCPICDFRTAFDPPTHLSSAVYIENAPAKE